MGAVPRDGASDDGARVVNRIGSADGGIVQAGAVHGGVHFHGARVPRPRPPVRPVSAWTARDLGVHASITVGDGESAEPPRYVVRRHDEVVRRLVDRCAVENVMVVLVGGSAVGKTRTAYEALLACEQVRSWPVIVPDGPAQLRDTLADGVPGRHVLWLNDVSSRFLDGRYGADLAERLASLLRGRGPVLVLADLWPSQLDALTDDRAAVGTAAAQVRHLLGLPQVEQVAVPDDFAGADEVEQARLRDCAREDHRLALAVNLAGSEKKITQLLAGGPQVLRAYTGHGYTGHAHALITAALDIARLGYRAPVDLEVLRHATGEHLDPSQRVVEAGWFTAALEDAARPRHGVAAVTPVRTAPDPGAADSCVLHDYLLHETSRTHRRTGPPAGVWTALAQRPPGAEDCGRLAATAVSRGLYRLAARFALPAAEAGDTDAMELMATLCELRGADEEARTWRRRAEPIATALRTHLGDLFDLLEEARATSDHTTHGDPADQALSLADELRREGRHDAAEAVLRPHADAKHPDAMWSLFLLLDHRDRDEECLVLLRELTDMGNQIALLYLVKRLGDNGADQEAERLLRLRAQHEDGTPGDPSAMWALGDWLVRRHRVPEAVRWYALSAEHSLQGANLLVETFGELGCLEDAERPLRVQAAKEGGPARMKLAELLGLLGRHDEAVSVLRESLEHDESHPLPGRMSAPSTMSHLVRALRRAGRTQEAAQVQAYGIEPGGATAQPWELPTPR